MKTSMVIQRPEFSGLVLCRELRLCVFADLAEAVDASEGKEGCPLNDELADKLLDSVSPADIGDGTMLAESMMHSTTKIGTTRIHIGKL